MTPSQMLQALPSTPFFQFSIPHSMKSSSLWSENLYFTLPKHSLLHTAKPPFFLCTFNTNNAFDTKNAFNKRNSFEERNSFTNHRRPNQIKPLRSEEGSKGIQLSHSSNPSFTDLNFVNDLKKTFFTEIEGIDRGIFGVRSEKKSIIENIINQIEKLNPLQNPTQNLEKVDGKWRLLYSTISISGKKKTKLGLREFITLSHFYQIIDIEKNYATNIVEFNITGISFFKGELTISASYKIKNSNRVDIKFENSSITPNQLYLLFQKNYNLLLEIFNPEGWLDITYVDDDFRIGRDDKGNIFVLERCAI